MAAYAALVSVMHIIDNLRLHPWPPIILHKEQAYLLTQKLTSLQEFLEIYNPNLPYSIEADPLETRIARAAYAAEDAIESHILDRLTNNGGKMSPDGLYEALENAIEGMTLIEKEAMEIKETVGFQNQLHAKSTPPDPSRSTFSWIALKKQSRMVGADDLLLELKDKLTSSITDLQSIPIVGMGGSGKTTLALNIFQDRFIEEYFDIRAWVTISQEYSIPEILAQLLTQLNNKPNQNLREGVLGEMLHKSLYGRKYMIVVDDIWSVKAWDGVKMFLPNNKNGSRIVLTTRLAMLASSLPNSNSLGMKLLDDVDSWDLLSKTVFGETGCLPEFVELGKKIAKNCKGLRLSIVVVGGLLAKSEQTIECWENIEENLNTIVNLEDDQRCLKTLYMSYKQLPVHLKPCFLYMGIFREDHVIRVSKLVKLWVAEGFLKPIIEERQEDVARAYLNDLIGRNLILIHELGSTGSVKECKVHDLLRDFCLREAQKDWFYTVSPGHKIEEDNVSRILMPAPLARSLILDLNKVDLPPHTLRLLRIVGHKGDILNNMDKLFNSRFSTFNLELIKFPSIILLFWNLQILNVIRYVYEPFRTVPAHIWYMTRIRHLDFSYLHLPDPPPDVEDGDSWASLQTLRCIKEFKCSLQVVNSIPNIRKLGISYDREVGDWFCLTNLALLDKLESLSCSFKNKPMCTIDYPKSLKKLALTVQRSQRWHHVLDKIGALPLLQKLKLCYGSFKEGQWETTEGQFLSLKFLSLRSCEGLRIWTASESSRFPRLEQLRLSLLGDLEEIPLDFAEISTLRVIAIDRCPDSAIESAKSILEEQEELNGEKETTLQIQVRLSRKNNPALKTASRSPNFHVRLYE